MKIKHHHCTGTFCLNQGNTIQAKIARRYFIFSLVWMAGSEIFRFRLGWNTGWIMGVFLFPHQFKGIAICIMYMNSILHCQSGRLLLINAIKMFTLAETPFFFRVNHHLSVCIDIQTLLDQDQLLPIRASTKQTSVI